MSSPIHVSCPHCGSTLKLKNPNSLGNTLPCPRCREPFLLEQVDDVEWADTATGDDEWQSRSKPSADRSTSRRRPKGRKSKRRESSPILIGGAVVGGILFIVIVCGTVISLNSKQQLPGGAGSNLQGGVGGSGGQPLAGNAAPVQNDSISEADMLLVGEQLVARINSKQATQASLLFDWEHFLGIAMAGFEISEKNRGEALAGFRSTVDKPTGMVGMLCRRIGDQGAKMLRIREDSGQKRIQVRFLFSDNSVNYAEFIPARCPAGIRIVDAYFYNTGEKFTQTIRRTLLPLLAQAEPSFLDRLTGKDRQAVQNLKRLQELAQSVRLGQFARVQEIYAELPQTMQKDKAILLMRISAAQKAGEEEYLAVLEDFRRLHPNDAAVELILVDYYFLKEDYGGAGECIKRLEAAVGGDAYLHAMLAAQLSNSGELDKARTTATEAIEMEPTLQLPQTTLLDILGLQKDHQATLEQLKVLRLEFNLEFRGLSEVPAFADFLSSPQHKHYLEFLNSAAGEADSE